MTRLPHWPVICPVCGLDLSPEMRDDSARTKVRRLRCTQGHVFDAARQGYVNLLTGRPSRFREDTPAMVEARERVHAAGLLSSLSTVLADTVGAHIAQDAPQSPVVVETGAGTGHYLSRVLDRLDSSHGIALDLSKSAAQRAARDERVLSLVWDTWSPWPLRARCADAVLDVFAPRNFAEFARVLRPGGILAVTTPGREHLQELRDRSLQIGVAPAKEERVHEQAGQDFTPMETVSVHEAVAVTPEEAADLAFMGPAGHHHSRGELEHDLAGSPVPSVTIDATVHLFRLR